MAIYARGNTELAVNVPPVFDAAYGNNLGFVIYFVYDAINSHTQAVLAAATKS